MGNELTKRNTILTKALIIVIIVEIIMDHEAIEKAE